MNNALSESYVARAAILAKINEQVEAINKSFKKRPETIDLALLKELLRNLEDTNSEIKDRKEEISSQWVGTACGIWTGRVVVVLMVVSALIVAGASTYQLIKTNNNKTQKVVAGLSIFGVVCSGIVGVFYTLYTREQDTYDDLQAETKFFSRFIATYEEQRKADLAKTEEIFAKYLQSLGALPQTTIDRFKLPPKPLWVEAAGNTNTGIQLNAQAETIAKKVVDVQKANNFGGEKAGHNGMFEPILPHINIAAEFDRMEQLVGFKLPYLSKEGRFYFRDGRVFTSVESAEDALKSTAIQIDAPD